MTKKELLIELINCCYGGDVFITTEEGAVPLARAVGMRITGKERIVLYSEELYRKLTGAISTNLPLISIDSAAEPENETGEACPTCGEPYFSVD